MKVVLFGAGGFASLAWACLTHDSAHEVAGFTVDAPYLPGGELHALPAVDFAEVEARFAPDTHAMLLPLSSADNNRLRRDRYLAARAKGYSLISWVSSRALTWPDFAAGDNVMIFEGAIVQPFARIGADSIVRSGCIVSHHVSIGEHCFLAPGACIGGNAVIGDRCFIGLNATVRDGVTLAEGTFVAAGAVVTADTEADGLYMGVPARRAERRGG